LWWVQTWQVRTIAIIHFCSLLIIVAVARCVNKLPRVLLLKKGKRRRNDHSTNLLHLIGRIGFL
jgi:hypothetical protein